MTSVETSMTIFQKARNVIEQDISEIIRSLNTKKVELFKEIQTLEEEFTNKQQQKQKEISKLDTLISQTEELGENNLLKIQDQIVQKLKEEISLLNITSKEPNIGIEVEWGFSIETLLVCITSSVLIKVAEISNSGGSQVCSNEEQSKSLLQSPDVHLCNFRGVKDLNEDPNIVGKLPVKSAREVEYVSDSWNTCDSGIANMEELLQRESNW